MLQRNQLHLQIHKRSLSGSVLALVSLQKTGFRVARVALKHTLIRGLTGRRITLRAGRTFMASRNNHNQKNMRAHASRRSFLLSFTNRAG